MAHDYQMEIQAIDDYKMDMLDMQADQYAEWVEMMESDFGGDADFLNCDVED